MPENIVPGSETEKYHDTAVKAFEGVLGDKLEGMFAAALEKSYGQRDRSMEGIFESQAATKLASADWKQATEGKNPIGALCFAMAKYGKADDGRARAMEDVTKYLGPTVAKTINLSEATEGGALIQSDVLDRWFDALAPKTALLKLGPVQLPLDNGAMEVPGFTGRPSVFWVGEVITDEIDSTPSTGMRKLTEKFIASIIEISNKMLQTKVGPRVSAYVENMARREVGIGLDIAFIRGAGSDHTPKGIRWFATQTTAMTATPTFLTSLTDFRTAFTKLAGQNAPMERMGWIWNPRTEYWLKWGALDGFNHPYFNEELSKGTLFGIPFASSNNVPANLGGGSNESELYLLDMEHVLIGQVGGENGGKVQVEYFREGSYVSGGATRSLMNRNTQAVRLVLGTDLNTTYTNAHHITTGLTWGA